MEKLQQEGGRRVMLRELRKQSFRKGEGVGNHLKQSEKVQKAKDWERYTKFIFLEFHFINNIK